MSENKGIYIVNAESFTSPHCFFVVDDELNAEVCRAFARHAFDGGFKDRRTSWV